jgi:predicted ATPase
MHGITFEPTMEEFHASRYGKPLTVFAGANNSGKSLALKTLKQRLGVTAYMLHPQRFYHVPKFGPADKDPNELNNLESNFSTQFSQPEFNHEQNYLDFGRVVTNLSDSKRSNLFALAGLLLGSSVELKMMDPDNELSFRYIDVAGRNLSTSSTGTRLLLTLLGTCMDDRFSTILIDEPELGLSPKVQQALAKFLSDGPERAKYFPHLQGVYLATHSHLFLDRVDIASNYSVTKSGDVVKLDQVTTLSEFHKVQFNLLGNTLEDMYLPAAILIVEGKTDQAYLERVVQQRFPDRRITVTEAGGNTKGKVASFRDSMGDLDKSPYKGRLFVVLDSVHDINTPGWLESKGVQKSNIRIWKGNGIEFVYPTSILQEIFVATEEQVTQGLAIDSDLITINGISLKKAELADQVVAKLTADTALPEELEQFLNEIASAME